MSAPPPPPSPDNRPHDFYNNTLRDGLTGDESFEPPEPPATAPGPGPPSGVGVFAGLVRAANRWADVLDVLRHMRPPHLLGLTAMLALAYIAGQVASHADVWYAWLIVAGICVLIVGLALLGWLTTPRP